MNKLIKHTRRLFLMIKRLMTFRVKFINILGSQKYKKETKMNKERICVLGISKL